jgi:hypothetical protein
MVLECSYACSRKNHRFRPFAVMANLPQVAQFVTLAGESPSVEMRWAGMALKQGDYERSHPQC